MVEIKINFMDGVEVSVNGFGLLKTRNDERFTAEEVAELLRRLDHEVTVEDATQGWNE